MRVRSHRPGLSANARPTTHTDRLGCVRTPGRVYRRPQHWLHLVSVRISQATIILGTGDHKYLSVRW